MAKSRKLLLAVTLLAGGYGLALSFSSLAEMLAQWTGRAAKEESVGVLVPIGPEATANSAAVPAPISVQTPEPGRPAEPAKLPELTEPPQWLASATEASATPAPPEPQTRSSLARVKDVTAWGPTASSGASPWDRWPAWQPVAPAPAQDPNSQARQASFQAPDAQPTFGATAAFDDGDDAIERRHIVVDGDSLARLADRYLDDPQLADEIYRLNGEVLSDPELLPIGAELVIPDRRVAAANRPQVDTTSESVRANAPAPFVPYSVPTAPAADAPRAQLLRPLPIGRGD